MKRRAAVCLLAAAGAASACTRLGGWEATTAKATPASHPDDDERPAPDDIPFAITEQDDYVVRIVAGDVTCSGTLIEESLVLTAHHCVSARNKYGDVVSKNVKADQIRIELGGDYLPWGEVGVRAIVAPPCGYAAGNGDIAVLVLERPLIGVVTLPPRLDAPPADHEYVDPVGFGRCALSGDGIRRKQRQGGRIDKIRDDRFKLNAAICPGDSGGPAVAETGHVLGVISKSVMDANERTVGRSEFTRVDHWRPLFSNAKLIAEGASAAEVPPIEGCAQAPGG